MNDFVGSRGRLRPATYMLGGYFLITTAGGAQPKLHCQKGKGALVSPLLVRDEYGRILRCRLGQTCIMLRPFITGHRFAANYCQMDMTNWAGARFPGRFGPMNTQWWAAGYVGWQRTCMMEALRHPRGTV